MSRPHHLLAVLQLFETGEPSWTVEQIAGALGMSTSSAYRHVRQLVAAGFLDPVSRAGYALGPAFIRYDRILRQNDLLINIARPVMRKLVKRAESRATVVLCRRFRDCVMCVHDVQGERTPASTS